MGPLLQEQALDMHLLLAIATFVGAASAMPMVYYPAQYIPADEVRVRVPRQLAQGPLRPVRQSDFAADQEASADTAYGAAPVGRVKIQVYRAPARAPAMTLSPPGDTTTPSLSTWARTTRPHSDDPDLARNHDQSVAQPKTFFTPSSLGRPSQDPDLPWSFQGGLRLRTLGILQHPTC